VGSEGLAIARVAGIEIRVSVAWVLLLALVTLLAEQLAMAAAPQLPMVVHWVVGGVSAIAVLLSVVAHELAHALTARRLGVDPGSVILGFVGGVSPLDVQGRTPRHEMLIAISGPVLSLVIAVLLVPVGLGLLEGDDAMAAVAAGLLVVGVLSGAFAGLSVLPGLPLDGGRIVRALAWERTGDPRRATRLASVLGRATGWIVAGIGMIVALTASPSTGVMLLSLGWFVTTGASTVERRLAIELALDGVRVADVMETDLPQVSPNLTLDVFADRFMPDGLATSLPVVADGHVVGVIGLDRVRRVGRRARATTRAEDIMARPPAAPLLDGDVLLWDALDDLRRAGTDGLAVVADDAGEVLRGMLTRRGATAAIRERLARTSVGRA
jgi:Zn-dependent protease/CBS domain-containing protein